MPATTRYPSTSRFSKTSSVNVQTKKKKKNLSKKSPNTIKRPFIPPPGKTSPGRPLAWESQSHRLEINPPVATTRSMNIDDLSSSENEEVHGSKKRFERNIDELLKDVSLNERRYMNMKTDEQLNASRRILEDQQEELRAFQNDLKASKREYSTLRRSFEIVNREAERFRTEAEHLGTEKETLLNKLLQVDQEGREASKEVAKLRDACRKLKQDNRFTSSDVDALTQQKDKLLDKLEEFEGSNKRLRRLLREAQKHQESNQQMSDKCEILMRKLTEAEAKIQDQSAQLVDQDKQIDTLIAQLEAEKHQAKTFDELHKTMEATQAHLKNEIRTKEAENNRLSVQCRKLEESSNVQSLEVEHFQGLLAATRDKSMKDKDALKKATRIQRERAQKQEDVNEDMQKQISALLSQLESSKVSLQNLTEAHLKLKQDSEFIEEESKQLRKNVMEIGNIMELSGKHMKAGPAHVTEKLVPKIRILKSIKTENEGLKEELKALEENAYNSEKTITTKLHAADVELTQLRAALEQYEGLAADYKMQLERYRTENDDLREKLQKQDRELQTKIHESMIEVNEVRSTLQSKLLELEPYPDLLKRAEIRLQDAQERASSAEKRVNEHAHLLSELTHKVEVQSEQLDHLREKYRNKNDENKLLDHQLQAFEKKLQETDGSHHELILSLGRKDEAVQSLQDRLDDQRVENERLVQQLEVALHDTKKQAESQREKSLAKERSAQARIMDLEAQLSRSTQNTEMLKRNKEEAERKFNSRLQDMRDRLEQANSTTRSMQNYVQFLKSTYANVFSDDIDAVPAL
ncbi:outer dense fiber protein 2-like [Hydractinia symbiolongicarpus]|uniref:outer dense fiber protein 2-like n=1 Tax=Hydractinia symbiolongicarpus TaxID=13093 RepID=UPI00254E37AD|nr:outer dense fiber protein 2-like [Hydractinia symbiolongicarpus]XP_057289966.1 outer dense fiber protein 2-like [Hydractinia symbiolongicarpus]XP_057289967.1 outer dense fiber protein 2-like [Hydractinia symbiolongicarpus]